MINAPKRNDIRQRVHSRIRAKMSGTAERPRLNVYRSLNHIYTQLIDDLNGVTLVSASSFGKKTESEGKAYGGNVAAAKTIDAANKGEPIPQVVADGINRAIAANPSEVFLIEGHTDSIGSDTANLILSQNRANAVMQYLTQHGVGKDKLKATGFGKSRPLADNSTAGGRAKNRRVELVDQP